MAIDNRNAETMVIHSDHGTQYTSWAFTRRALDSGLTQSMATIDDCYDNGQMESFWAECMLSSQPKEHPARAGQRDLEYLEILTTVSGDPHHSRC